MTTSRDPNSVIYIGFWERFLAYIIDTLVILLPFSIIILFFKGESSNSENISDSKFIVITVLSWIYSAGLNSSNWQATIGKKVLGIIVVDEYGDRLTFKKATCRFFAQILSSLLFYIGFMMVGWTKHKQGLHDKIAKTFVIKK